jgi:hypothetical protein
MATRSKRSGRMPSHRPTFLHATCLISPRGLIQHHHAAPQLLLLLAAFAIGATCVLAGCGTRLAPQHSPSSAAWAPAPATAPVRFDPSISYDDALRAITDLGLQPSVACGYEADLKAGRVITDMQWQPAGQRSIFVREHRLFVTFTPLAAPDWGARLTHVHGFVRNTEQQWDQGLYCPDLGSAAAYPTDPAPSASVSFTPPDSSRPAQTPTVLAYAQAISSPNARVVFTPSITYAEALSTISDLGVRLADPCYERKHAENQPTSAQWPGAGQEQRFSASHSLIVAAAPLATPIYWEQMLGSGAGIADITVPYTATC